MILGLRFSVTRDTPCPDPQDFVRRLSNILVGSSENDTYVYCYYSYSGHITFVRTVSIHDRSKIQRDIGFKFNILLLRLSIYMVRGLKKENCFAI